MKRRTAAVVTAISAMGLAGGGAGVAAAFSGPAQSVTVPPASVRTVAPPAPVASVPARATVRDQVRDGSCDGTAARQQVQLQQRTSAPTPASTGPCTSQPCAPQSSVHHAEPAHAHHMAGVQHHGGR